MLDRVEIVGGGPSGLFLAILLRKSGTAAAVIVREQNPPDVTFGFGIAIKQRILDRFEGYDAPSIRAMRPRLVNYDYQIISVNGHPVRLDYADLSASIARSDMLRCLQEEARAAGADLRFGAPAGSVEDLARGCDLLVGADGSNSAVREALAPELGSTVSHVANALAWYGTSRRFAHSGLSFRRTDRGNFVAHFYPYGPDRSTFVAECDARTWRETVSRLSQAERTRLAEEVFAEELDGHPLIDNKSIWRHLTVASNERWFTGNCVLVGDALKPAHPSIGSGTRLAIDDAIALFEALQASSGDLAAALPAYQAARSATRAKLNAAMMRSYRWYERIDEKLDLDPEAFVYDYLTRTGRIDDRRMERDYPDFMARYTAYLRRGAGPARAAS